jgi:hypothetical protein
MDEQTKKELERDFNTLSELIKEKKSKLVDIDVSGCGFIPKGEEKEIPVITATFTLALDFEEGKEFINKFYENFLH